MNIDQKCFYCMKDARLDNLMVEVCRLNKSTVYLFKDQTFPGRCVVAYHDHCAELFQLPPSELHEYMDEVAQVAEVIFKNLKPNKINYAILGDLVPHTHVHLVPKYENGPLWGEAFCAKPLPVKTLPNDEFEELKKLLAKGLGAI
ncbi:MAG TPA: HIT family protein [Firmicutes bacterium]|jgi:ATP adenylyltransferase|nr:HIT family protein [Bacillota bacterium]